jgi:flagellar motility protein MotE (MotC chaperone)
MILIKILEFSKKNWKSLSITVFLLAIIIKLGYDYSQMSNLYQTSQENSDRQIQELKEVYSHELYLKEKALEEYKETMRQIEEEYKSSLEELKQIRVETAQQHIDNFSGDKEALARDIQGAFGFRYVP